MIKRLILMLAMLASVNAGAQTFTGTVQANRTNSNLGAVFNVVSYGATGNGTTDDTAAIQAAINDACLTNKGGTVYFPQPASVYLVKGQLVYPVAVTNSGPTYSSYPLSMTANGAGYTYGVGGVTIDFEPSTPGQFNFIYLGQGNLQIHDMGFEAGAGLGYSNNVFFLAGSHNIHNCYFSQNTLSNQSIWFTVGNPNGTAQNLNTTNEAFDGFASSISDNNFNYGLGLAILGAFCSNEKLDNDYVSVHFTGSFAIEMIQSPSINDGTVEANTVSRCGLGSTGPYVIVCSNAWLNNFINDQYYDLNQPTATLASGFTAGTVTSLTVNTPSSTIYPGMLVVGTGIPNANLGQAGGMIDPSSGAPTVLSVSGNTITVTSFTATGNSDGNPYAFEPTDVYLDANSTHNYVAFNANETDIRWPYVGGPGSTNNNSCVAVNTSGLYVRNIAGNPGFQDGYYVNAGQQAQWNSVSGNTIFSIYGYQDAWVFNKYDAGAGVGYGWFEIPLLFSAPITNQAPQVFTGTNGPIGNGSGLTNTFNGTTNSSIVGTTSGVTNTSTKYGTCVVVSTAGTYSNFDSGGNWLYTNASVAGQEEWPVGPGAGVKSITAGITSCKIIFQ